MITIREIAEQLGVSPTTVSNVLNGRGGRMSSQTRKRVEEALVRNHYVHEQRREETDVPTHLVAVYFCLGKKEHILMDPFCGELLESVEKELQKHGRSTVCGIVNSDDQFDEKLKVSGLEGAILLGCNPENCESLAKRTRFPIVFVDSGEGNYDNIGLQDFEGAYEITSYLLKQGNRKLAFFCDQQTPMGSNRERYRGFRKALERYRDVFLPEEDYVYLPEEKNLRHEVLRQFARKSGEKGYTGAFFVYDLLANEAINIFFSQGLQVPGDISVTGFDDNIYARLSRPMLTTVRQHPSEKGKAAVRMLMRRIYGEETLVSSMQLPTELIVRESVANRTGI